MASRKWDTNHWKSHPDPPLQVTHRETKAQKWGVTGLDQREQVAEA